MLNVLLLEIVVIGFQDADAKEDFVEPMLVRK